MNPAFAEALTDLPQLIRAHVLISATAIAIAAAIGLPLAFWAAPRPRLRVPLLGFSSLVQTVPTLALLALIYLLLLATANATGAAIPALGFLPALIALVLYALLPIVRNCVAARQGLDPNLIEAAIGIGMTRRQRLFLVELPLSAGVLLAGIRTATVWTIGAATLATTVGQPSLGNLIFSGLQTENWARVLVGCFASAALALVADGLLALVEQGLARRSAWRLRAGLGLLIAALALTLWPAGSGLSGDKMAVVGAKNFSEQYILASAIEERLRGAGYRTARRDDLGSTVAYRALANGNLDVYVDYTGTLWANILGRTDIVPRAEMTRVLTAELQKRDGVLLLGSLGFENAYAFAMRRERAEKLGIRSLDDLSSAAPQLKLGSDIEFLSRPEWRSVASVYGMRFADQRSYNPTFMYRAVVDGSADVISAFSSDGRISALDLVTLSDPRGALPSYDAVLLVSPKKAEDRAFIETLRPLLRAISIERMREANYMVDRDVDKRTPRDVGHWLLQGSLAK